MKAQRTQRNRRSTGMGSRHWMRRGASFIASSALSAFSAFSALHALAAGLPPSVQDALVKFKIPQSSVSVVVEPVGDGPVLVSHRASEAMNPASVMKLVTTFAALDQLGPAFTFRTDFLLEGELVRGVLEGNLVIRAGGDPKITYDTLWRIAHQLRARGLREIRGDIVIDRGYFASLTHDPGRFDREPRRAYNVGVDALLVNYQVVNFTFVAEGQSARVVPEPDFPNVQVVSRIAVTQEPCGDWRHKLKADFEEKGLVSTVVFSGNFPADCGEKSWPLAVFDGPRFTESALRWLWSEAGGVLKGKVREGATPPGATLFHRHESEPLANLVRDMNKFSSNVMARHLFLALSAERGAPGETGASARVVREWLAGRRIDAPGLSIENGSGLSRSDRVSAATIAALLRSIWASPVMPEIVASLPVYAVDGTLKTRRGAAIGQAHLKGGTLTGVQSVAGYVLDTRGRRWIVVMIVNDANAQNAQPAIDTLVEWVHRLPGKRDGP
ncbi:MAG TPA: D-alanyl-D-alanine carboxypeptidase/D-alanyl-D-alanine-endopeptidase [Usitatibacter sp.]|nr:D-alanyl-D-alanine carboxypeptidase/D-alanyl-D-alanine-endopeptidase [Usitatibacter sp.]